MTSFVRYGLLACFLWLFIACGRSDTSESSQVNNNAPEETQAAQPTEHPSIDVATVPPMETPAYETGQLVTREPQNTPTRAIELPSIITYDPNLVVDELIEFKHKPTGITGLMPKNWTLFENESSFQASSAPPDPNGFIAIYKPGDPAEFVAMRDERFQSLKENYASVPNRRAKILKEDLAEDGSGTLETIVLAPAQGNNAVLYEFHVYARAIPTDTALILTFIMIPEDNYLEHTFIFRTMVESIRLEP